jgi:flagella basal body P-ring formation protein FlgA
MPANARAWGHGRVGLRCLRGAVKWNVYVPVTVKVFAPALVAAAPLSAGSVVAPRDLRTAEVDIAAGNGHALKDPQAVAGRTLCRSVAAGAPLRSNDLKPRQWFAAGDSVRIVTVGAGYTVTGEGLALTPGIEGQPVRVRTEGGRIVLGQAVAQRRVEVAL